MRKRSISIGHSNVEPIDHWLENNGFHRKQVPRDASCLFRAVAEQVCYSQSYHEDLRNLALDYMLLYKTYFQAYLEEPLENYVRRMRSPFEFGSRIELIALSFIFKIDFIVFDDDCLSVPRKINYNEDQKLLYQNSSNHYDIVYPIERIKIAGFCQALVYEILYSKVFKMDNVNDVVDWMLHDSFSNGRQDSVNSDGQELDILRIVQEVTCKISGNNLDTSIELSTPEKGLIPPFPYRVAKALDPNIYRNSEYDTWIALKREARFGPYDPNGFQIGAKVLIKTNQLKKTPKENTLSQDQVLHGHIQFMTENQGPVEVFAEELGRRITVPYNCLEKCATISTNTPKYCYRESSFVNDSPPTYRILSSITNKPSLPIPENYNSPVRGGKVKKKDRNVIYPMPDRIISVNCNNKIEEESDESKNGQYPMTSCGSSINSSENAENIEVRSLNESSNEMVLDSNSPENSKASSDYQPLESEIPMQHLSLYQPCYDPNCGMSQYYSYYPYGEVYGYYPCVPYSWPCYYAYPDYQYFPGNYQGMIPNFNPNQGSMG